MKKYANWNLSDTERKTLVFALSLLPDISWEELFDSEAAFFEKQSFYFAVKNKMLLGKRNFDINEIHAMYVSLKLLISIPSGLITYHGDCKDQISNFYLPALNLLRKFESSFPMFLHEDSDS